MRPMPVVPIKIPEDLLSKTVDKILRKTKYYYLGLVATFSTD